MSKGLTSATFTAFAMLMLVMASGIFLSGCANPLAPQANATGATAKGISDVVNANNKFAFDYYSQIKDKNQNIFFSPYSISTALAMTYEGAKGKTADEMQKVFYFPQDSYAMRSAFASIYNEINKANKTYKLSTANALWVQKDYLFLTDYLGLVESYYGGKATNLDFIGETEKSRQTINTWVEDQTNDKIKNLIPPGALDSMTRLVLTNAVYFKGDWVKQFDKKDTMERDFRTTPDNTIKVQMMHLTSEKAETGFNYTETENLQVLELPYSGEELSMLILLPKNDSLVALDSLSAEKLAEIRNNLTEESVSIYMPKFKLETEYGMAQDLAEMGMPTAFDANNADFSGMTGEKDLYIGAVIHKAFVDVNEEGTEAAAATAVIMTMTSAGPSNTKLFNADHPFMFVIQERETGNVLFLGRIVNPTSAE